MVSLSTSSIVLALLAILSAATGSAQAPSDPAAILQAQERQSAELAASWLTSQDARVRAWGAYLSLRDRRRELLPQLMQLVNSHPVKPVSGPGPDRDAHDAMLSVLDAVIQLDGRLAPADAARLYPEFPVHATILLTYGDPQADRFLLTIFREETKWTGPWLASGNRLMDRKPAGFAAAILRDFTVEAHVTVVDKGARARGGGIAGSCPSGLPQPRSGWPTVGNYSFDSRGVLMVRGTYPSMYMRTVGGPDPSGGLESSCSYLGIMRNTVRAELLGNMVGDPQGRPAVLASVTKTIEWQSDAQYLRDVRAFVEQQRRLFETLRAQLVMKGLLTAEERSADAPRLDLQISDERTRRGPLPPFSP